MVKLLDGQQDHFNKVYTTLQKYGSCMDTSALGSGKTYVAAMISKGYTKTLIVSTGTVLKKWKQIKKDNPDIHTEYIYSSFLKGGDTLDKIPFGGNKILIVLDEVHKYRNDCKSTYQFLKVLYRTPKEEYDILCISSTPMDRPYKQLYQITALLGVTKRDYTTSYIDSFIEFVSEYVPEEYEDLYFNTRWETLLERFKTDNPRGLRYDQYIRYYRLDMIQDFIDRHFTVDCALLNKSQVTTEVLMKTLSCRESHTVMQNTNLDHFGDKGSIYSFFGTEFMLEIIKYREYRRDILQDIRNNPNRKFIIMLKYTVTITLLQAYLSSQCSENIAIITTDTTQNNQQKILDSFQEPNLDTRVLVCCICRTSTGIDLDDKYGNFNRTMYLFKGMKSIDAEQARSRIKRLDTKSDSVLKIPLIGHDGTFGRKLEETFVQ